MFPTIQLGTLALNTYSLMYSLAFIIGGLLALDRVKGDTREDHLYRNSLVLLVVFVLVGLFLPSYAESYIRSWITGQPRETPHMRVYYGLTMGLLACLLYLRHVKLSFLHLMDRAIPVFGLAFAIARVGCLGAGCCGGAATSSPLGMYAPDSSGVWAMRYPTQIMSMGFELLLFVGLSWLYKHRRGWLKTEGVIFYLYIFLFCLERFALEWLRFDYRPMWGPLSLPHLYMLAAMLVVAIGLARLVVRGQPPDPGVQA